MWLAWSHGRGRLSRMYYQAVKRRSCCGEKQAMCEFMFLSNPSYLKVLIGALFHFMSIGWGTADAFCLFRHNNELFIVTDSSVLKLRVCVFPQSPFRQRGTIKYFNIFYSISFILLDLLILCFFLDRQHTNRDSEALQLFASH